MEKPTWLPSSGNILGYKCRGGNNKLLPRWLTSISGRARLADHGAGDNESRTTSDGEPSAGRKTTAGSPKFAPDKGNGDGAGAVKLIGMVVKGKGDVGMVRRAASKKGNVKLLVQ